MKPENLKARNALIRDLRAGLGSKPMTLDAIGRKLGLTRELRVDGRPLAFRTVPKNAPVEDVRAKALMFSMRDCFAAAALTGFCANPGWTCAVEATAQEVYRLADAMMAEREARWEVAK